MVSMATPPLRRPVCGASRYATGFTLIELLTVIALVGVLASLAYPSFAAFTASQRAHAAATDLFLALMRARSEAIKRSAVVTITPAPSGWQAGWRIAVDASGATLEERGPLSGVAIGGAPARVSYHSSGRVRGLELPSFLVAGAYEQLRCISVDPAGRPNVRPSAC